jgi:metal-responsive CopG/Arc/MetJ family transcriptional regulator
MARAAKIAVTIDRDLLARAEAVRERTGESRSAVFARALRELVRLEEHQRKVRRYVEANREQPETPDEMALARHTARRALRQVPWESE